MASVRAVTISSIVVRVWVQGRMFPMQQSMKASLVMPRSQEHLGWKLFKQVTCCLQKPADLCEMKLLHGRAAASMS